MFFFPSCNLRERLDHLNRDIKGKFLRSVPQINLLCFPANAAHLPGKQANASRACAPAANFDLQEYLTAIRNILKEKNPT